jgi:hypothetical protein
MQKEARELRDFINRRVLDKYPLVSCHFVETAGHHVKITLGAPNGRSETIFCTAGGDPTTRNNVERDVKGALRKLNIALQGEDRTMASIATKKTTVNSFKEIAKARDLNEVVDTAPKEAKLQVNGNAFHASPNHKKHVAQQPMYVEAQRLRDQGKTLKEISEITGINISTVCVNTTPATKKVELAPVAAEAPRKQRATPRRKTQENVFKISMHLSTRCSLVDELAVYEEGWSDEVVATTVGNGCEADDVKELRIKHIGRLQSEIPKSHLAPEPYQLLKRIQKLEAEVSLLKGLSERVQLLEDAVTKP